MDDAFFQNGEFGPVNVCVDGHVCGRGGGGSGAGRYGGYVVCSTLSSLQRGVGRGGSGSGMKQWRAGCAPAAPP